jgi:dienelactone hydrolase
MPPIARASAWIPPLSGLALIAFAARASGLCLAFAALPGALLLAGGVRCLLAPELRAPQHSAIGAALGLLLALPIGLAGGAPIGFASLALSAISFVAAGWLDLSLQPELDGVPAPPPALGYAARVALDGAMLGLMTLAAPSPRTSELRAAVREAEEAHALYRARGWIERAETYHRAPPELAFADSLRRSIAGVDCEALRFESGYEPDPELPGRERWLAYRENRTCHAWIARHPQPGPWLVCVHGAGMGNPNQDFRAFRVKQLHERARLNLAAIALPVHGPRAPGGFSGAKFLGTSPLDFVHAESQAVWDLRRLVGWLRKQDATAIGVFGISLGGYTSALFAGLEDGLACVVAGVPPTDLIDTAEYLATTHERRVARAAGIDFERDRALHRVVSPLAFAPRLARERRYLFGATGDRFVPAEQVRALWQHWERPAIAWSTGGHVSALLQREPRALVDAAIAAHLAPDPARIA